jgi:homospermidine synthase
VNLSVDTSSLDLMKFCREIGVPYIDTVVEPWAGYYFGTTDNAARTNYALRQAVRDEKARQPGRDDGRLLLRGQPRHGVVVREGGADDARRDTGADATPPAPAKAGPVDAVDLGVKGVHIAERDTQARRVPRPRGVFVNTWSVEGFIAEGFQPAELGWGTTSRGSPRTAMGRRPAARPRSGSTGPARSRGFIPGARRRGRNSAFS